MSDVKAHRAVDVQRAEVIHCKDAASAPFLALKAEESVRAANVKHGKSSEIFG